MIVSIETSILEQMCLKHCRSYEKGSAWMCPKQCKIKTKVSLGSYDKVVEHKHFYCIITAHFFHTFGVDSQTFYLSYSDSNFRLKMSKGVLKATT